MNVLWDRKRARRRVAPAAGPPAWTPASVAGLLASYAAGPAWCFTDTAGTTPCAVGDAVACWKDGSGALRHMLQGTAASRPALRLVSGAYAVQFDAIDDALQWSGAAVGSVSDVTLGVAFRNVDGSAVTPRIGPRLRDSGAGNAAWILWNADKTRMLGSSGVQAESAAAAGLADHVAVGTIAGGVNTIRLDGVAATQAVTQTARSVNLIDVAFDGPLGGYVYGFAAYAAALAGDDLLALEEYLAALNP